MSEPTVDVRGVLQQLIRDTAAEGREHFQAMAADGAVAELIEAVRPAITDEGMEQAELDRLRVAFARVGGA